MKSTSRPLLPRRHTHSVRSGPRHALTTELVDLATPLVPSSLGTGGGDEDLGGEAAAAYRAARQALVEQLLAAATPESSVSLFPGTAGPALGTGAAGVLVTLAEAGVDVPGYLTEWLVEAAEDVDRPGLLDGAAGVALALDRLARPDAAQPLWDMVADACHQPCWDVSLASGLAGVGLALLERAPAPDEKWLIPTVEMLARRVAGLLDGGPPAGGLVWGRTGGALFLLHVAELTGYDELGAAAEQATKRDLAALGWAPLAAPGSEPTWWQDPTLGEGSAGVAMVLRNAEPAFGAGWSDHATEWIATAAECHLPGSRGLLNGASGTALAIWHLRRTPWDTAQQRRALMHPHMARLGLLDVVPAGHVHRAGAALLDGAAGELLALEAVMGARDVRTFLF